MERILIDKDYKLKAGDVVEMEYVLIGGLDWVYFRSTQVALLEYYLRKENPYWFYKSLHFPEDKQDHLILEFEVREMPENADPAIAEAGITAGLISAFILGTFVFAYLALDKIYLIKKLPDKPSDVVTSAGIGLAGVAVIVLVLFFLLGKIKFKGNPNPEICGFE